MTLGYDRDSPFIPTPAQSESWQGTQEEYGAPDLADFLDSYTTARRVVFLSPFLMETAASDADSVNDIIAENPAIGFRAPTPDEWKWACGSGARTLWRWGNDCPTRSYPTDNRRENAAWNLHRLPNAFGMVIDNDDYNKELCAGNIIRGGDGGVSICGRVGYLAAWLTLASSLQPLPNHPEAGNSARAAWFCLCRDKIVPSVTCLFCASRTLTDMMSEENLRTYGEL